MLMGKTDHTATPTVGNRNTQAILAAELTWDTQHKRKKITLYKLERKESDV